MNFKEELLVQPITGTIEICGIFLDELLLAILCDVSIVAHTHIATSE